MTKLEILLIYLKENTPTLLTSTLNYYSYTKELMDNMIRINMYSHRKVT